MSAPEFCLVPGFVISQQDGDEHYIGVGALSRLYRVQLGRCRIHDYRIISQCEGLVHLRPRADGNYGPVPVAPESEKD